MVRTEISGGPELALPDPRRSYTIQLPRMEPYGLYGCCFLSNGTDVDGDAHS